MKPKNIIILSSLGWWKPMRIIIPRFVYVHPSTKIKINCGSIKYIKLEKKCSGMYIRVCIMHDNKYKF